MGIIILVPLGGPYFSAVMPGGTTGQVKRKQAAVA
jgi:hypothetical protein